MQFFFFLFILHIFIHFFHTLIKNMFLYEAFSNFPDEFVSSTFPNSFLFFFFLFNIFIGIIFLYNGVLVSAL